MADLITLEEFKALEGLESNKKDAKLSSLITMVSQLVKTYCANTIIDHYSADKTEYFTITEDISEIQLSEMPVVSITSVEERSSYGASYTALTTGSYEYYLNESTDTLFRTTSAGFTYWAKGPGSVKVVYKAGYATTPADLKLAVVDLINYFDKDEHKPRRTIGGSSMANDPSSTQWRNVSFPDHIKRVLDLYKVVHV